MISIDQICWSKYGDLLIKTIKWFRKRGRLYRSLPWREEFLYKYSRGVALDLGCGLAATTRELLKTGYFNKLVLLDIVEETLIEICSSNYRLFCVKSDVLKLPFGENSFDIVFLLAVLHHIPGVECRVNVLSEAYRVVKQNSYLLVTVWYPDKEVVLSKFKYIDLGNNSYLLIDNYGERYYYFYSINELVDQIERIGFKIIDADIFVQNPRKPSITKNIYVVAQK